MRADLMAISLPRSHDAVRWVDAPQGTLPLPCFAAVDVSTDYTKCWNFGVVPQTDNAGSMSVQYCGRDIVGAELRTSRRSQLHPKGRSMNFSVGCTLNLPLSGRRVQSVSSCSGRSCPFSAPPKRMEGGAGKSPIGCKVPWGVGRPGPRSERVGCCARTW